MFFPTGHKGEGMAWRPISLSRKSGSIAVQIRYSVISSKGQLSVVPPVPNFTESIPSFFSALTILRIVTGLFPVEIKRRCSGCMKKDTMMRGGYSSLYVNRADRNLAGDSFIYKKE